MIDTPPIPQNFDKKNKGGGVFVNSQFFSKIICEYMHNLLVQNFPRCGHCCHGLYRQSYKTFLVRVNPEKYQKLFEILTKMYYYKKSSTKSTVSRKSLPKFTRGNPYQNLLKEIFTKIY